MTRFWAGLFVLALGTFVTLTVQASTVLIFAPGGALIYQCQRTGDAVILPTGEVQVQCGDNVLTFPGSAAFLLGAISFQYSEAPPLPVTRSGGTYGTLSASLSVDGPCVVDPESVTFAAGATVPSIVPHITAMSGMRAGTCSVSMGAAHLAALVGDLTCKP